MVEAVSAADACSSSTTTMRGSDGDDLRAVCLVLAIANSWNGVVDDES